MTEKHLSVHDGKKSGKVKISIQADGIKMTTVDVFSDTTELSLHEEEKLSCPECHVDLGKDSSIIWISLWQCVILRVLCEKKMCLDKYNAMNFLSLS